MADERYKHARYKQRLSADNFTSMRFTYCTDCGCVVADETVHDDFHARGGGNEQGATP